jgi:riboflavin kinase/FMN adenylyltransferase
MRVITENTIHRLSKSSVVTVGNFDGIHQGHRALIDRCHLLAAPGQDIAVVCFEPLPQAFFKPEDAPARLTSPAQKALLLEQAGVDLVWMMRFDRELAEMSPEQFAGAVLNESLSAGRVVVGEDFRFGRSRHGNVQTLTAIGENADFEVEAVADVQIDGVRVSSSAIRSALAESNLALAERYLGRPYTLVGEVTKGLGLGRDLGYPTANLMLEAGPCPLAGVFAVRARINDADEWLDAVASLGNRPVLGGKDFEVEVHIFDFSADIYGRRLEVEFVEKIRDEENFGSIEELVKQIRNDEARSRKILRF